MGTTKRDDDSLNIKEFCEKEGIFEPTYFKLREQGLGPDEMRYPGMHIVRITERSRLKWQDMMHNPPPDKAELVASITAKLRAKGRSPKGEGEPQSRVQDAAPAPPPEGGGVMRHARQKAKAARGPRCIWYSG
jgi:hypothetical protein